MLDWDIPIEEAVETCKRISSMLPGNRSGKRMGDVVKLELARDEIAKVSEPEHGNDSAANET
jgi:hypothetical protein